jgi:hypothetical protein
MTRPGAQLRHIRARRRALRDSFSVAAQFAALEESCVPSYLHPNPLLAYAAWWRLLTAARLAASAARPGPVLDFGASVGELYHLLPGAPEYGFIEGDELLAGALRDHVPGARALRLENLPEAGFATIFALDSLEHNARRETILGHLERALEANGALVVSGPTENFLYRLGRRLAGFRGHGHETDIHVIEAEIRSLFRLRTVVSGPFALPLFRVSLWEKS